LHDASQYSPSIRFRKGQVKRTDRRSRCPINFALELFGDSWSLLIVRDLLFTGKRTFAEFAESEERISTNILSTRLKSLAKAGIIRRDGRGRATRYSLTPRGVELLPLLLDMIAWSARHDPRTAADAGFVRRLASDRAALLAELEAGIRTAHGIGAER
jgi:DNA-binding HxlR family transcriptional regulator